MKPNVKQCKCGSYGPFYKDKKRKDGLTFYCRVCCKKQWEEYRLNNREKHRESSRSWYHQGDNKIKRRPSNLRHVKAYQSRWPEKKKAKEMLNDRVNRGKIKRDPCVECGNPKTEGHHEDYSKPLEVIWLCTKHHMERHRKVGVLSK